MFTVALKLIIADKIYGDLDQQHLSTGEQKRWRKRSRGTNYLLYIDRAVFRKFKSTKTLSNVVDRL